jgi:hypothetical protein
MVKQQTIGYNEFTKEVFFYEGKKQANRVNANRDISNKRNLRTFLEKYVDKKRQTELVVTGFDELTIEYLRDRYDRTKVKIISKNY